MAYETYLSSDPLLRLVVLSLLLVCIRFRIVEIREWYLRWSTPWFMIDSFASSNYLSLRVANSLLLSKFLSVYINKITNTAQYFHIEIFHVSLCCRLDHIWCITSTMAGSMSQLYPLVRNMNNKAKKSWTVVIFTYWGKNILSATKSLQIKIKRDVREVFVRILPEKYDLHPLNLQPLQPIKAHIGLKIILERPSKRSWVIAVSVLTICKPR